jgi:hypothetical protein
MPESYPCDFPLTAMFTDVSSPIFRWIVLAMLVISGLGWILTEHGTAMRKLAVVAFGGACGLQVMNLITTRFPGMMQ